MRVSFVLPAYKRRFLREAVASILAQTFRDFELIVVDDCSPENLREVVDGFDDPRLFYRRNERNLGGKDLVAAWDHALSFASGEWCVLASDDDCYLPTYLERMLDLAEKHPDCDLFRCRAAVIDVHGRWIKVGTERAEHSTQIGSIYARLFAGCDQTAPEFMFRRSALASVGGFVNFPAAWFSDDATWATLARNGLASSPEVLFCRRISGINISTAGGWCAQKFVAARRYKAFLANLLSGLSPASEADRVMLSWLKRCYESRVDQVTCEECRAIGLARFFGLLRQAKGEPSLCGRLLRTRFPLAMSLVDRLRGKRGVPYGD